MQNDRILWQRRGNWCSIYSLYCWIKRLEQSLFSKPTEKLTPPVWKITTKILHLISVWKHFMANMLRRNENSHHAASNSSVSIFIINCDWNYVFYEPQLYFIGCYYYCLWVDIFHGEGYIFCLAEVLFQLSGVLAILHYLFKRKRLRLFLEEF